jgi:hypothetical protein
MWKLTLGYSILVTPSLVPNAQGSWNYECRVKAQGSEFYWNRAHPKAVFRNQKNLSGHKFFEDFFKIK